MRSDVAKTVRGSYPWFCTSKFAVSLGHANFCAINGYLQNFKKSRQKSRRKEKEKKRKVENLLYENTFLKMYVVKVQVPMILFVLNEKQISNLVRDYQLKDIYYVDETGTFV